LSAEEARAFLASSSLICDWEFGGGAPERRALVIAVPRGAKLLLLSSRAALEGERKQVTVFFVDVKGSTSEPALFLKRHP
jgi:class 3 adenylate cyclase